MPGDGIGPEILAEGVKVLKAAAEKFSHDFVFDTAHIGGAAIDATGDPLPEETVRKCRKADAVFLAAVGGPKWDSLAPEKRPEKGLLRIRKELALFANLRPAMLLPELAGACLLRADIAARGLDLVVVRELTGDIYFGEPRGQEMREGLRTGYNTMVYNEEEIRRIATVAFETARKRRGKVCSVEKSNVLETSRLWKEVVLETHRQYADVELTHMYVDNAAMQLVRDPSQFDVILTGNIFGDILSDEASVITGSLGMGEAKSKLKAMAASTNGQREYFMIVPLLVFEAGQRNCRTNRARGSDPRNLPMMAASAPCAQRPSVPQGNACSLWRHYTVKKCSVSN